MAYCSCLGQPLVAHVSFQAGQSMLFFVLSLDEQRYPTHPSLNMAIPIKFTQLKTRINEYNTDILLHEYSDRYFIVLTQLGKIGTFVRSFESSDGLTSFLD